MENMQHSSVFNKDVTTCRSKNDFGTVRFHLAECVCFWVCWQTSHEDDVLLASLLLGQDPCHREGWVLACTDNELVVPVHPTLSCQWYAANSASRKLIFSEKCGAATITELVPADKAEEVEGCAFTVGPADTALYVYHDISGRNRRKAVLFLVLVVIFTKDNVSLLCIDFG